MKGQIAFDRRLLALLPKAICLVILVHLATGCRPFIHVLTPNVVINVHLPAQATHQYRLALPPGQYTRLILRHARVRIQGKLYDQQENLIGEFYGYESGEISISVLTEKHGNLRVVLQSLDINSSGGSYQLTLTDCRRAQPEDQVRRAAESHYFVAEKLRWEWKENQSRAALEKYQEAARLWNSIQADLEQAQAFRRISKGYFSLGDLKQARKSLDEALRLSQKASDIAGEAEAYVDLGELSISLEDFEQVKTSLELALAKGQELSNSQIIARATANLGLVEGYGNLSRALLLFEKVAPYWEEIGDRTNLTGLHLKKGIAYFYGGEIKQALISFQLAIELAQEVGNRREIAFVHVTIGHAFSVIGEKQEALKAYNIARPMLEESGDKLTLASLISGLGFVYDELGNETRAMHYRQQALELYQALNAQSYIYLHQMYVGELHYRRGNYKLAYKTLSQALEGFRNLKDRRMESQVVRDIGLVYAAQGQNNLALSYFQQALNLSGEIGESRWKAYVLSDIGQVFRQLGKLQLAESSYRNALALNRKVEDRIGASQTLYYLAKLELDKGHSDEARALIEESLTMIESLRTKVLSQELRTSYFASVNRIFGLSITILMQQQQQAPSNNFAQEALTINEQSRARSLLDLLNESPHDIKQGVDPKLLEQERALRQTLNGKADRKLTLANQTGKEAELSAVTKEVDDLTTQLDEVRSKIRETSPRYAAITQPQPLKAEEIQQLLDDDTLLLEYALGDECSYVWAVTRTSIDAYVLPNRATIEPLVREVYQLMTAPLRQENESIAQVLQRKAQANERYWPRAAALSQMILGPVADKLANNRLLIVGDGALQLLPFAALPEPVVGDQWSVVGKKARANYKSDATTPRQTTENDASPTSHQPPLIVTHEITNLPSASSLKLLREDRARMEPPGNLMARWKQSLKSWWGQTDELTSLYSVAVLADPVFEKDDKRMLSQKAGQPALPQTREVDLSNENLFLPRLIATRNEAAEIQKAAGSHPFLLKCDFDVNRQLLESDELNRFGVLHLATHGYWDSNTPELSSIFLSRFDQQGQPTDGALRLSDVYNLKLRKELVVLSACETALGKDIRGEGLIALTRGFMYAGAARVMASLWKVEDTATAEMMKVFYQHLLQRKLSPATALRQAQIAMWQKEPTKIPYHWAAFVLQGEYR